MNKWVLLYNTFLFSKVSAWTGIICMDLPPFQMASSGKSLNEKCSACWVFCISREGHCHSVRSVSLGPNAPFPPSDANAYFISWRLRDMTVLFLVYCWQNGHHKWGLGVFNPLFNDTAFLMVLASRQRILTEQQSLARNSTAISDINIQQQRKLNLTLPSLKDVKNTSTWLIKGKLIVENVVN